MAIDIREMDWDARTANEIFGLILNAAISAAGKTRRDAFGGIESVSAILHKLIDVKNIVDKEHDLLDARIKDNKY